MRDLDPVPLGPNLPLPLMRSISKPKRSTRSSSCKSSVSISLQKFRNVSNRMGKGISVGNKMFQGIPTASYGNSPASTFSH
nr:hypothetical protein [Tanacetum cinerariifolium]